MTTGSIWRRSRVMSDLSSFLLTTQRLLRCLKMRFWAVVLSMRDKGLLLLQLMKLPKQWKAATLSTLRQRSGRFNTGLIATSGLCFSSQSTLAFLPCQCLESFLQRSQPSTSKKKRTSRVLQWVGQLSLEQTRMAHPYTVRRCSQQAPQWWQRAWNRTVWQSKKSKSLSFSATKPKMKAISCPTKAPQSKSVDKSKKSLKQIPMRPRSPCECSQLIKMIYQTAKPRQVSQK